MKKVLALAFVVSLALSCTKKESTYEQDTNVMLEEPKTEVVQPSADSTTTTTATPPVVDSVATPTKI